MSAGKNRQSRQSRQSRQTHRLPLPAAVLSAVERADVRCAARRSPGLHPFIGAARGCLARPDSRGGAAAPGVGSR
jgi:hypothetical protein